MNSNNEEIIGYKKTEVIGKSILDVFPENEAYCFEKFDGAGLGLAISKEIIVLLGGEI